MNSTEKNELENEAKKLIEAEETLISKVTPEDPKVIGKIQEFKNFEAEENLAKEIGWKNVPVEFLPSQGLFYEIGTQIAIRAATVAEIRHWSMIDENDLLGVDDMLNFIIEKCVRIKSPSRFNSYKDIKELDRFYLLFAIRDLTFKNGENKLYAPVQDSTGNTIQVELKRDSIHYYEPDERLMKYYSAERRCFEIALKNGEKFDLFIPSLGVVKFIKNYVVKKQQEGKQFDKTFIKYAPFLFDNWRELSEVVFEKHVQKSFEWSVQKISVLDKLIEILSKSINPQIRSYSEGGEEVMAPLNFQGGIKNLFLLSDVFDELL